MLDVETLKNNIYKVDGLKTAIFIVVPVENQKVDAATVLPSVTFKADGRLKDPIKISEDLAKRQTEFFEDGSDKYYVHDIKVEVFAFTHANELVGVVSAKELYKNLLELLRALPLDSVDQILLLGPDVTNVWRAVIRNALMFVTREMKVTPVTYKDLRGQVITESDWDRLTPEGKRTFYYHESTVSEFYKGLANLLLHPVKILAKN